MPEQTPEKDEYSRTRQQMTAHIDVCMGGRVAEELIFGLEQVTSPFHLPLLHLTFKYHSAGHICTAGIAILPAASCCYLQAEVEV